MLVSSSEEAPQETLRVEALSKRFGDTVAVWDVSFRMGEGELLAVLGPSGCGKSTLLHLIAGLETPDKGRVFWKDVDLSDIPTHQRDFGLMFQDLVLFPHMNVSDNIGFGLRMRGAGTFERKNRVAEMLALVGLPGFADRAIDGLSGGELQRVALARALAPQPRLLMLDEPMASLDRTLKEQLMLDLPRILRAAKQTAILVTHDQEEAFALAERLLIMDEGKLVQRGTPRQIYLSPASAFVANFLGLKNLFSGKVERDGSRGYLRTTFADLPLPEAVDGEVNVLLRPERAELGAGKPMVIHGQVLERSFRGNTTVVVIKAEGGVQLRFEFGTGEATPHVGEQATVSFDPATAIQVLPQ
jgi:ABC-type Fe3+/spermidine/putrescine transport system ATPase subunit